MARRGSLLTALAALLVVVCQGCASYRDLRFAPAIQDAELRGEESELQARLAVAWRGVRKHENSLKLRFRVSVENPGFAPFPVAPARFELLDAALASMGVASTEGLPVVIDPGTSATFDIAFFIPAEQGLDGFDLDALLLRTGLHGERWNWTTTFQRVERVPPEPYGKPLLSLSIGATFGR